MKKEVDAVILGAGISGLGAAWNLCKNCKNVLVLEKEKEVGGLARTIHLRNASFDYGIHGFFASKPGNEKYIELIKGMVGGENLVNVNKATSIYFRKKYVKYPLGLKEIFTSLDIITSIKAFCSFIIARIKLRVLSFLGRKIDDESFEGWVTNRFGQILFRIYFGMFADKTWGISSRELSSETLGRRVSVVSVWDVFLKSIFAVFNCKKLIDKNYPQQPNQFLYALNGVDFLPKTMLEQINQLGGQVLTGIRIKSVVKKGEGFKIVYIDDRREKEVLSNQLVSTIPLFDIARYLNDARLMTLGKKLLYRSLIIVNIIHDKGLTFKDQWVYFPDHAIPFTRINEFANIHESFITEKRGSLCVEIPCFKTDDIYCLNDEKIKNLVVFHLEKLNLLRNENIIDYNIVRIPTAYPIYTVTSKNIHKKFNEIVKSYGNFQTIGRQGGFDYINMDEALEQGMMSGNKIIDKKNLK